jgi:hypothetical protein
LVPILLFVSMEIVKFMQVRAAAPLLPRGHADALAICRRMRLHGINRIHSAQGAIFVNHDQRMRDPATGEYALARNTNLNEVC